MHKRHQSIDCYFDLVIFMESVLNKGLSIYANKDVFKSIGKLIKSKELVVNYLC